ncbi:MAG TPA: histidine phosphatase family protein [Caulobacteraceae bacterium]|nr:histidine phosphatase family protein [Caulobacteraceae bacterium]
MELLLIRHGLPERTELTSDPPLTAEGVDQAHRVARALARERVDAVFASTMRRAVETARPFVALSGLALDLRDGIVEFDRGSGTYIPLEQLKRDDYPAWQAFVAGGHQEDIVGFQTLVVETLEDIIARNSAKTVAVFCHGGVINVWTAHVLGMAPRLFFEPAYASVHRYLCARSGQRNLVSLNDTAHLRGD